MASGVFLSLLDTKQPILDFRMVNIIHYYNKNKGGGDPVKEDDGKADSIPPVDPVLVLAVIRRDFLFRIIYHAKKVIQRSVLLGQGQGLSSHSKSRAP